MLWKTVNRQFRVFFFSKFSFRINERNIEDKSVQRKHKLHNNTGARTDEDMNKKQKKKNTPQQRRSRTARSAKKLCVWLNSKVFYVGKLDDWMYFGRLSSAQSTVSTHTYSLSRPTKMNKVRKMNKNKKQAPRARSGSQTNAGKWEWKGKCVSVCAYTLHLHIERVNFECIQLVVDGKRDRAHASVTFNAQIGAAVESPF